MTSITTQIRLSNTDPAYFVVTGTPSLSVGEKITLKVGKRTLGERTVVKVTTKKLSDITEEDTNLLNPAYKEPRSLWASLEREYGGGLPGEFLVSIISVTEKEDADISEFYEEPEEEDVEEYEEFPDDDELQNVVDEYEDLEGVEKIFPTKKRNYWDD